MTNLGRKGLMMVELPPFKVFLKCYKLMDSVDAMTCVSRAAVGVTAYSSPLHL